MQKELGFDTDFTTEMYRKSLVEAKSCWRFIPFTAFDSPGKTILWRHDVDISVHRAHRLAEIEAEEGVRSTYFFLLHSEFYNLLSPDVLGKARAIVSMGHYLGLHFDPAVYGNKLDSTDKICESLSREKGILEHYLNTPVEAFSWHNPTQGGRLEMNETRYAGMINAYGSQLGRHYRYASDSNGIWRHDRLHDVVKMRDVDKLHILTHPEWWQETAMAPRTRVYRCAWGHAKSSIYGNDQLLTKFSRENISGSASAIAFLSNIDRRLYELLDYLWNTGSLEALFLELWRFHESQIYRLCRAELLKQWLVPAIEINRFFENASPTVDSWRLFTGVFGQTGESALDPTAAKYMALRNLLNTLLHGRTAIPSDTLEEGSVCLCSIIESLAAWGKTQAIHYDGIGDLDSDSILTGKTADGSPGDHLEENAERTSNFSVEKWEKFKIGTYGNCVDKVIS